MSVWRSVADRWGGYLEVSDNLYAEAIAAVLVPWAWRDESLLAVRAR